MHFAPTWEADEEKQIPTEKLQKSFRGIHDDELREQIACYRMVSGGPSWTQVNRSRELERRCGVMCTRYISTIVLIALAAVLCVFFFAKTVLIEWNPAGFWVVIGCLLSCLFHVIIDKIATRIRCLLLLPCLTLLAVSMGLPAISVWGMIHSILPGDLSGLLTIFVFAGPSFAGIYVLRYSKKLGLL